MKDHHKILAAFLVCVIVGSALIAGVRQPQLGVYGHRIDKNNIHHRWLTVIDDDQGVEFVMPNGDHACVWRRGDKLIVHCDGSNIVTRGHVTNQLRIGFFEDDEEDTWGFGPTRKLDPKTRDAR